MKDFDWQYQSPSGQVILKVTTRGIALSRKLVVLFLVFGMLLAPVVLVAGLWIKHGRIVPGALVLFLILGLLEHAFVRYEKEQ